MASSERYKTNKNQQFIAQLVRQVRSTAAYASIISIEIGGSVARSEADAHSDLDIFMYINGIKAFEQHALAKLIQSLGSTLIIGGPSYKQGFGVVYTADYSGNGIVSFILREEESIGPNFMRAASSIVYDPYKKLQSILSAERQIPPVPRADLAERALATSYFRLLDAGKELARNNVWQARKYYREVLEQLLVLERLITNIEPRGRNYRQPGRGMERDFPPDFVSEITSLDAISSKMINKSLIQRTIQLLTSLQSHLDVSQPGVNWPALYERVSMVFNEHQ
jgi:predicted nucleotidyltransferase